MMGDKTMRITALLVLVAALSAVAAAQEPGTQSDTGASGALLLQNGAGQDAGAQQDGNAQDGPPRPTSSFSILAAGHVERVMEDVDAATRGTRRLARKAESFQARMRLYRTCLLLNEELDLVPPEDFAAAVSELSIAGRRISQTAQVITNNIPDGADVDVVPDGGQAFEDAFVSTVDQSNALVEGHVDQVMQNVVAELSTNKGAMVLEFFPDVAPGHVQNFVDLARKGFYDGLPFHRVIPGFMVQGGCPKGDGTGNPGYKIKAEFNDKAHTRGSLSMARSGHPDSAGSQFFICHDTAPHLDGQYTNFGHLLSGYETLDAIAQAGSPSGATSEQVVIEKVSIRERSDADTADTE